jgi:hypothetical protein
MKRVILVSTLILLSLSATLSAKTGQNDCEKCDCIHLPCPKECKPCCGMSTGLITDQSSRMLSVNDKEFSMTANTEIRGQLTKGAKATVYFRKLGDEKVAQKIVVEGENDRQDQKDKY